jgi:hypothetical protein
VDNGTTVAGGNGLANSITGTSVTRAVGGRSCAVDVTRNAGGANTGTGGDGGKINVTATAGENGGSGVVIIRHLASYDTAVHSGTFTTSGGYKIYTFNASGSIGWS